MARLKTESEARARLVETADRLFYAHGFRAVGIDRVIAEAGVAKATLYAHFPSKDDLIVAVLEHRDAELLAYFSDAVKRHRAAQPDALAALFATLKEWFASPDFRGCLFQNAAAELADLTHPGRAAVEAHKRRFHDFIGRLVRDAVGPRGEAVAPAVALLVEGAVISATINRTPDSADVARAAAAQLVDGCGIVKD